VSWVNTSWTVARSPRRGVSNATRACPSGGCAPSAALGPCGAPCCAGSGRTRC